MIGRSWGLVAASGLVVLACSERGESAPDALAAPEVHAAAARARFGLVGASAVTFQPGAFAGHLRASVAPPAQGAAARPAHVDLPVRAADAVIIEDATTARAVSFALEGVQNTPVVLEHGLAIYPGALAGADVVHRVHAEGTEDFVLFDARPPREELTYRVDVSRVEGLRLVASTLELLAEDGTPVLRVAPPYVVDAAGARHAAQLTVSGCSYDRSPAGPWGRPVTAPGAQHCSVHVSWSGVTYPAMVDPAWTTTGSLLVPRRQHTATLLASGRVLIARGASTAVTAPAELFDPGGNGGGGTFAVTGTPAFNVWEASGTSARLPSGKVLLAGGAGTTNMPAPPWAKAELYDPATGTFTTTGSMSVPRTNHTVTPLADGRVLVAGGLYNDASAEIFDPAGDGGAGSFAPTGTMRTKRAWHAATVLLSGRVLMTGGELSDESWAAEVFDPKANGGIGAFLPTGPMAVKSQHHTSTLLASGKVLIAGGTRGDGRLAQVFDPLAAGGTGGFSPTGPAGMMAVAHYDHSATLLPSGQVLVVGGTSELFDPLGNGGAGTFVSAPSPLRAGATATLLPSGRVLAVGGTSAEIFGGAPGDACGTAGPCFSGHCVDGVCCESACSGPCEACSGAAKASGASGTCGPRRAGAACGAASVCAGSKSAGNACDGAGTCAPKTTDCAPGTCAGGVCASVCTTAADCAAGAWCSAGVCRVPLANGAACERNDSCASAACADGVCCDRACAGQCEACDVTPGTCSAVTGTPHGSRPLCAVAASCNGVASVSCVLDSSGSSGSSGASDPGGGPVGGGGCAVGVPVNAVGSWSSLAWSSVLGAVLGLRLRRKRSPTRERGASR